MTSPHFLIAQPNTQKVNPHFVKAVGGGKQSGGNPNHDELGRFASSPSEPKSEKEKTVKERREKYDSMSLDELRGAEDRLRAATAKARNTWLTSDSDSNFEKYKELMEEHQAATYSLTDKINQARTPQENIQRVESLRQRRNKMKAAPYFLIANTTKSNPHRDYMTGKFTYGPGNLTRDREDARHSTERKEAQAQQQHLIHTAAGHVMLPEHEARAQGQSVNENLNVKDPAAMQRAAKETGGSRVFSFSQGDGSILDRNVKFVTNTNSSGTFERGALRVEIFDPDSNKRHVYQRKMDELPKLVGQVLGKRYAVTGQHRRNTANFVKAENAGHWVTHEGKHVFIGGGDGKEESKPSAAPTPKEKNTDYGEPSAGREKAKEIESVYVKRRIENGAAISKDGEVILEKKGDKSSITFTKDELESMRGAVFTHNHPGDKYARGGSFSLNDVIIASAYDLKEMRAVTTGEKYVIHPQAGGKWASPSDIMREFSDFNGGRAMPMNSMDSFWASRAHSLGMVYKTYKMPK